MRRLVCTVVFTAAVIAACTSPSESTAPRRFRPRFATQIDHDSAHIASGHLQLIKGWGVDPGIGPNPFYSQDPMTLKAESLLYNMGITFIRDQIDPALYDSGSTIANMTLNTDTLTAYESKWYAAKQHNLNYILSVWSPPAKWKTNNSLDGGQLVPDSEPSYVAFVTKVMEGLSTSNAGLPIALSIANEPNHSSNFPTTVYDTSLWEKTIDDTRGSLNFVHFQSVTTFGPELGTYDSTMNFLGDTSFTHIDGGFFATQAIGAYAFHGYGLCNWPSISTFISNNTGRDAWVTEYSQPNSQGVWQLGRAIDLAGALGAQMETLPINYWAWWEGYARGDTDKQGGVLMLITTPDTLAVTSMYYELNKLWKTVIPGTWYAQAMDAVWSSQIRISASGQSCTAPRVDLYAFEKPGDSTVVVFSNRTANDKYMTVKGLPTTYKHQHAWLSDTTTINQPMKPQDSSTVWVGGDNTGRTVLYAPARSVVIAILN